MCFLQIRVSLMVLQLHVALQLLWTVNCFGAVDILNPLSGLQGKLESTETETVTRRPSTKATNNVWRKPSFKDEVQEHSFHSRRLSQRRSTDQLSGDGLSCSLNETQVGAIFDATTGVWLVDDGVLSSFDNDIQAIINCTTENDTVFIRTENTVTPQTTITIPWNLTLSSFIEDNPTGGEGVPEANSKVTFRCPENGQLIVARSSAFVLANIAFIGCTSVSDIILLEPRCAYELEGNTRSRLLHIDFTRNKLSQNGNLLNATQASCTQLTLEDVKFTRNRCGGQGCVLISTNTELRGIRAVRNRNNNDSPEECSFFSIQNVSEVVATDISALKNEIRVMRIHNSYVRIRDSHFERNNRIQVSTSDSRESGGGVLFANQSTVSIDDSTFQNNSAYSGGALYVVLTELNITSSEFSQNMASANRGNGGAIYSRLGRVSSLVSTNFSQNVAWKGGALSTNTTSVSLADCRLVSNNGNRAGACSFWGNSSIQIERAVFDGNRAINKFAGAILVVANITIEIKNSTFQNNQARDNGGAVDISSRCHLLLSDVAFISNTARVNGSALQLHTFTEVEVIRSNFSGNRASFGGAMYSRTNSSLSISQSRCTQNEAAYGGCLHADLTTNITISESVLERNRATREGGAIRLDKNSTMSISNTSLKRNNAVSGGGAIGLYNNSTISISNASLTGNEAYDGGALHARESCNVNISNSKIEGNTARFTGGGIGSEVHTTFTMFNSSLRGNVAQSGGGFYVQTNGTLTLLESRLVNNNASFGGCVYLGASNASMSLSKFRDCNAQWEGGAVFMSRHSNLSASDLTFIRNKARGGGAIGMNRNCMASLSGSIFRDNTAKTDGGAVHMDENCAALVISSTFRNNTARIGGAIALESGSLAVQDTHVTSNEVTNNGGGIHVSKSSSLNATGLYLRSNSADRRGGAICLLSGSSFLCYKCTFEDNTASNGAGMYGESNNQEQSIRAQLQDCTFARNSAQLSGGGLQFDSPEDRENTCFQEGVSCGSIVLLNSSFVDNSAVQSGAAILLSDPESILVSPTFNESRQEGFLDVVNNSLLSLVDPKGQHASWTGNRVRKKDAGGVVGTYGRRLSVSIHSSNAVGIVPDKESGALLTNVQSGQPIPTIQITVLDAFGQSPAPTSPQSFNISVMSPESFFQGVITTNITNGTGSLTNIIGFGTPGDYSLKITPLNNEAINETTLRIQVRECVVGEEPTRDRVLCQECGDSAYNFHPETPNSCKSCPEHATCRGHYIAPVDGYWHRSPCHYNISQCITEEACTHDKREEVLYNFSQGLTECAMNKLTLLNYSDLLCRTGYEGPLCGSCAQSYGLSIGYECSKCPHALESIVTLALLVFYLLVISSFTLRGGLPYQTKHTSGIEGQSSRPTLVWSSSRSVAINVQMVEMMRDGHVPPEVLRPRQSTNRSAPSVEQRNKAEMTGWKTSEIFKVGLALCFVALAVTWQITINFLQVMAAAAGVAVRWTGGIMTMFKASEITGALTTVALFRPVDCVFPSSSALVRSLWRTMFGLFVPGIVVGTFIACWGLAKMWKKKPMSFFWKRSLLSLMVVVYISYLGLTKLAVRVFYCVDVLDSENHISASRTSYWAVDTAIKCYGSDHSILVTIGVSILVLVTLSFPLISAFVITRGEEQQDVSESWINETMGFLYRAFAKKFRYWESVVMLRKAFLSVIVVFSYPLGGQLQTMLALLLLMFSLCLQTICKPYRQEFNTLNHYESSSLFVSCVTLTLGQFLDSNRCSSFVKGTVAFMIVFINTVTFLFLLLAYLSSGVDHLRAVLEDEGVQVPDDLRWWSVLKIVLVTKISQWCDSSN